MIVAEFEWCVELNGSFYRINVMIGGGFGMSEGLRDQDVLSGCGYSLIFKDELRKLDVGKAVPEIMTVGTAVGTGTGLFSLIRCDEDTGQRPDLACGLVVTNHTTVRAVPDHFAGFRD